MLLISTLKQCSWECIHFVDDEPQLPQVWEQLRQDDITVIEVSWPTSGGSPDILQLLATAFEFPDYFGRNWDAVDECLNDLSWLPAQGYILVLSKAEYAWSTSPRDLGQLVQSWQFCAQQWSEEKLPFHLLFVW